jgi:RNA polymerase subunit RPABC4/transcription elongation factor Spt4
MADEPKTKHCEACDAEIGKDEKVCPKCAVDFDELEETVTAIDRANAVLAKRKAKAVPPEPAPGAPPVKPKGVAKLRALGRAFKPKA